ncbi:Mur ligase family protein [Phocicoccus pinnipedialis]|uniref:Lipid II isoglutaminyl synthase (glutamine-hydrolyzing) subunit MurT n=1 Tax=Phocicoccus pinnipedialis TaxID=110845 RepID=A0A6V7R3R1_9BACL|nr:Mur ligase family protein [Jeotgalicoccus pinnipedialis]MBP1940082.1 UDP-N-acetylmuramoyl-L-alanyl-D-glutamate--2,6-diaminopimelate ligase [Jeotgalicoccus pinnipedialis]CAD2071970.1 UDP-N-acetylmuramoylalanine--D-glutamate ligase [Jeotgalicoccus pinnipedialis]
MSIRTKVAQLAGRSVKTALKLTTGGGSSLPGKVAHSISPNIINDLAKNYDVVIITGTNGKTLTTTLTYNILSKIFNNVITNRAGSNMTQGIVGAFLDAKKTKERSIAVIEVDEGSLNKVVKALDPKLIVHTNLFDDQTDRYGDTKAAYQLLVEAANKAPNAKILANGDLPLFNSINLINEVEYFGLLPNLTDETVRIACPKCGGKLDYHTRTYSELGDYECSSCGVKRPELKYSVSEITKSDLSSSTFTIDDESFTIPIAGIYNIYNALAAYAVAKNFGVESEVIRNSLQTTERVFGRQEIIPLNDKTAILNVVKNPVGLNQVIDLIKKNKDPMTFVAILNNRPADGVDLSWLIDGDFEKLAKMEIEEVLTGGIRADRMTETLVEAGFERHTIDEFETLEALVNRITQAKHKNIQIIATYTAMLELRKVLKEKGLLK